MEVKQKEIIGTIVFFPMLQKLMKNKFKANENETLNTLCLGNESAMPLADI